MLPIGSTHTGDVVHTHGYIGSVKASCESRFGNILGISG